MICELETYPENSAALRGTAYEPGCNLLSTIWLWLRLWSRGVLGQGTDPHYDNAPRSTQGVNRAARHLHHHLEQRPIPPVRNLASFYKLDRRVVTPTQFLERRCRLSCAGRIEVYRILYYAHRMVREALMAIFEVGDFRAPTGLCAAHLRPN